MKITNYLTTDKKLQIVQDTDKNSFTFDSLLLSNFVTMNKKTVHVVDLCTGNAPIAMLLTRQKTLNIDAVEIQDDIYKMAVESVRLNQLENQITLHNQNLINISEKIGKNKYQLVTCNPPYFLYEENSNIHKEPSVAIARHEISVNFEQIVIEAKKLLDNTGRFCFVHRPQRLAELILTLDKYNFSIKKMQFVYPKIGEEANTVLIEAKKGTSITHMNVLEPIIVYDTNDNYTKQAQEIINQ